MASFTSSLRVPHPDFTPHPATGTERGPGPAVSSGSQTGQRTKEFLVPPPKIPYHQQKLPSHHQNRHTTSISQTRPMPTQYNFISIRTLCKTQHASIHAPSQVSCRPVPPISPISPIPTKTCSSGPNLQDMQTQPCFNMSQIAQALLP